MSGFDWERARKRALVAKCRTTSRPMSIIEVPPGASGYRGVYFQRDKGRFRAAIEIDGRRYHLGYFRDPRDAARAYDGAALSAWRP